MKRRYRYMLNLLSLCFLAFALYLNFVKRESEDVSVINIKENSTTTSDKGISKPISEHSTGSKIALK